ncbi:MAG: PP2C family protein-serine/threonine phosphatase [Bryobacteraceae bacterium]
MGASIGIDRVVENINRLIYAATPVNRYATFFYGQYDPAVCRLTYVNAGHNAPIVLHKQHSRRECVRLKTGGPPVGLFPQAKYDSGEIDLQPGDLIVLFTDGMSEAMNAAEEEWGECRLIGEVVNSPCGCPAEAVEALFRGADAFTAGAPQHDDMTVVVLLKTDP